MALNASHLTRSGICSCRWHELLQGDSQTSETVAIATGKLASGWHGTGAGELAGWSGQWRSQPPAIAHFVGGAPAGGKVDIMQGLNWWIYEADVVAHAVHEETGKTAGCAISPLAASGCARSQPAAPHPTFELERELVHIVAGWLSRARSSRRARSGAS